MQDKIRLKIWKDRLQFKCHILIILNFSNKLNNWLQCFSYHSTEAGSMNTIALLHFLPTSPQK